MLNRRSVGIYKEITDEVRRFYEKTIYNSRNDRGIISGK